MLFHELAHFDIPRKACPNTLVVVERNGHTVTCAAEGYSKVHISLLQRLAPRVGDIRVVHTLGRVRAEVHHFDAAALHIFDQLRFIFHARVVAANSYFHIKR